MILFINRNDELKFLNEKFKSERAEFIVIYGRRRVGKTELIKQFIKGKKSFYFLAKKQSLELELRRFTNKFGKKFNIFIEAKTWEELFEKIADFGKNKRFVIVIDEFSYWLEQDTTISSTFQIIWDEILKNTKCYLILCGSLVSMMESLLSYKNPLYGRRTGQWKVNQFDFFALKELFPNYTLEDLVKVYACVGGIPQYLLEFSPNMSVEENIQKTFLRRGDILYEDAERLLKDELREPIVYLNIMECVNEGATTLSEISEKAKVNITNLPKYLKVLISMGLIKKEFPPTVIKRKKKKGIYKITDNYFRFWLKFIYPFKDEIEMGSYGFSAFKKEFNKYVGEVFEDTAKQFLIYLNRQNKLPFKFTKVGRWWYKDKEIDLVALNENTKEVAFFECKWFDLASQDWKRILEDLKEKSMALLWFEKSRKEYFGLIAKKIDKKNKLAKEGCIAYELEDFYS